LDTVQRWFRRRPLKKSDPIVDRTDPRRCKRDLGRCDGAQQPLLVGDAGRLDKQRITHLPTEDRITAGSRGKHQRELHAGRVRRAFHDVAEQTAVVQQDPRREVGMQHLVLEAVQALVVDLEDAEPLACVYGVEPLALRTDRCADARRLALRREPVRSEVVQPIEYRRALAPFVLRNGVPTQEGAAPCAQERDSNRVLAAIRGRLQGAESQKVRDQAEMEGAVHELAPLDVERTNPPSSSRRPARARTSSTACGSRSSRPPSSIGGTPSSGGTPSGREVTTSGNVAAAGGIERHSRARLVWVGGHAGDPGAVEVVGEHDDLAAPVHPSATACPRRPPF
jgi:hypothetical protein